MVPAALPLIVERGMYLIGAAMKLAITNVEIFVDDECAIETNSVGCTHEVCLEHIRPE